jgi:hypothetical protein
MNINFKKTITFGVTLVLIPLLILCFPILISPFFKPKISSFPINFSHKFLSQNHFYQSLNNCGSYSVAGALNVFNKDQVNPEKIAKEISFKVPNRFTLPIGLEDYLKSGKMQVQTSNVIALNDKEKIDYLKSELSQGKVGIILIRLKGSPWYYLHYITLLGYNESEFLVYDSLAPKNPKYPRFTVDLNDEQIGNKSIKYSELIQMLNQGNIFNYPKNYHIFTKPKDI